MDDLKTRIVRLRLKQRDIAEAISYGGKKVYYPDLCKVINGRAPNTEAYNRIRFRLEKYLIEKEKERGIS